MQAVTQNKFRQRLEHFNSPGYTYLKLLFRQLAVYLFAFAVGILGFHFMDIPFEDTVNSYILGHFSYLFSGCEGILDYAEVVLSCGSLDIVHLIFIFVAGFTMFTSLACALAAFFRGLAFGFSAGYLSIAVANGVLSIGRFEFAFLIFLIFNILAAAILITFSAKAVMFSFDYQKPRGRRRKAASFAVSALILFGALMILALIRCALSVIYIF